MIRTACLFSQILGLVDRAEFAKISREHHANRCTKKFTAWDHFISMVFCQFAQAKSLRETCDGLGSAVGKAVHLGIANLAKRSTLAYANEHRPAEFFKALFFSLSQKLHSMAGFGCGKRKFRFKNRLVTLDSSVITLCLELFPWADYTRTKGGVKLHLLLDNDGYWPSYAHITEANCPDIQIARTLALAASSVIVIDRAYVDFELWGRWTRDSVYFVTRLKSNIPYQVIESRDISPSKKCRVLSDEVIQLTSQRGRELCPYLLRRVVVRDEKTGKSIEIITNNEKFAADTIGKIYRDRWQIELFFKALKQNLKVKTFLGTSRNALEVQLWTALISILLVKYLQWKSKRKWSLSNLVALLRWNLFQHKHLWSWLEDPLGAPPGVPDHPQLLLPGINFGQLHAAN